ncbi:hypothetical protein CUR178_03096 [Leishmania enriettii]|uniref:Succinyl-coa:3-ketoacid-coenzyme a transferase-like protein n=1 Tax=Leishmania enriettii TaxID=5663 RepID=A0A836GSJ3_LEIEN|nr:hypothetical protein CUR178_03096 [Leishmania enriettii]
MNGEFAIEFCPMGTLVDRLRAAGAGLPAFYTPTGYGTAVAEGRLPVRFVAGCSMRVAEYSQPRETRQFNGRWCTLETALPADFAFVRAWKADARGNLVFRGTTQNFNLAAAKAAKVCIAEVEEIVEGGELDPKTVHLPGVYVHRLVRPPNIRRAAEFVVERRPGFSSGTGKNAHANRNLIARRAALEIKDGMTLNLGIGIPNLVASYIPPEVDVVLQGENGLLGIGPYPLPEEVDPDVTNAGKQTVTMSRSGASLFDSAESFGMIRGGHLDLTMLGALEVSSNGDIASWWVPGKVLKGMGGAMDLVMSGCRTVVLMEHTDKEGKPRVVQSCSVPLTGAGVVDFLITELCTFRFEKLKGGVNVMWLSELSEGVSVEEVRAKAAATLAGSTNLKIWPLSPVPNPA